MSYEFTMERLFDATPEEVFEAITDPAKQREWWALPGHDVDAACDLRVGGSAYVEWEADHGHRCRAEQVFIEIERPARLVFTEIVKEPTSPVYECTLTMTLESVDGKTLFTLHHVGFPTAEERDKHQGGTKIFSGRLESYLARARR